MNKRLVLGSSLLIIYPYNHSTILFCNFFCKKIMKLCNNDIKIETVQVKMLFEIIKPALVGYNHHNFKIEVPTIIHVAGTMCHVLTWIVRQVGELHRLTVHAVWNATERHVNLDLFSNVLLLIRRRLEDNGDLPMHVSLCKLSLSLPVAQTEDDLDVVCGIPSHRHMHAILFKYINSDCKKTILK